MGAKKDERGRIMKRNDMTERLKGPLQLIFKVAYPMKSIVR